MQGIFLTVLNMSIVSSYVIAVVLVVRLLLRRAPRRFSYILWTVVLLRLLCPFSLKSPASLVPVSMDVISQQLVVPASEHMPDGFGVPEADGGGGTQLQLSNTDQPLTEPGFRQLWLPALTTLWLLGVAVMVCCSAVPLIRLRRKTVGAVRLQGGAYLADHIPTAFVMGLLRPRIYMPSGVAERSRAYILLHERAHIRRLDHVFQLLAFAALAVHWFNPLVWLAFILSGRDMEMSCDEAVVGRLDKDMRADYCQTLLELSAGGRLPAPGLLHFGEGNVSVRVKNILRYKKAPVWVAVVCVLIVVAALVVLLTDAPGARKDTVSVSFPAYQGGRDVYPEEMEQYVDTVYHFEPFTVSLELPEGWTVAIPPEGEQRMEATQVIYGCPLYTPVYLCDGDGETAGLMGWYMFAPEGDNLFYMTEDMTQDDYYRMMVYNELTRGNHYFWHDFRRVARTENSETALATVYYQEPIDDVPAAAWPQHEVPGICCYDTGLGVYIGIQILTDSVDEDDVMLIAQSVTLSR